MLARGKMQRPSFSRALFLSIKDVHDAQGSSSKKRKDGIR